MPMSTIIRDAEIVTASDVYRADVRIEDERIAAIGEDLPADAGDDIIDGSDQLLIPGGIDPHVHMALPFMGTVSIDDMARPGFEGAKYVCSPPLRTADHQEELWKGLVSDDLQVVSTDHAPFNFHGQKDLGKDDFSKIPNGLPSVEDRFTLLYQGVIDGRIGLNRFVEIVATAPAQMFGLYPRKGTLAPGFDADLVVFDPEHERTISAETHHMNVDYSCYEGRRV